jgi:bis(5'-nucleosidyl)-tetraphosphatase
MSSLEAPQRGGELQAKTLSAGVVVVRRDDGGWLYLLLRAYNYWDFPKGKVDPGENPLQAAQREAEEEAGIKDLSFPWGQEYRETPPYGHGKVARYYLAQTGQKKIELTVSKELGRPEHHEARWISYAEACRLLHPRLLPILHWTRDLITEMHSDPEKEMI